MRSDGRPLVLCADDYGMNGSIDDAIKRLAAAGRISATSCMSNAPGWPEAAGGLVGAGIGVGLHLVLTWGAPLGAMPVLAPGGRFPPLGSLLRRCLTGRLPLAEVASEIVRQMDAFEAARGGPPDFIDGHQHVHVLPGIRGALLAEAERRGWAGRVWLRDPSDRLAAILKRRLAAGKALFVGALASGFRRDAAGKGFSTNRGFSGFGPFDPARDVGADVEAYLAALGPAPLVMCHPGRDLTCANEDEIAAARVAEYQFLLSEPFGRMLETHGLRLAPSPGGKG